MERENPMFKEFVKIGITPMLSSLSVMTFAESESEILGLGIGIILMNIGMYFVLPFVILYYVKRSIRTRRLRQSSWVVISSNTVLSAVKKTLFGIVALLVLTVSLSTAFEPAYAAGEEPIRMVLDVTLENIEDAMEGMDNEEAVVLYEAGKAAYDDAIAALEAGEIEDAKNSALIAMELFEGATEEVLTAPPAGLGVGGVPPGLAKQITSSSIFEVQEEITAIDKEVEQLKTLVDLNGLDIDLEDYTESITVAKTVLVSGDIPNAKNQLGKKWP